MLIFSEVSTRTIYIKEMERARMHLTCTKVERLF